MSRYKEVHVNGVPIREHRLIWESLHGPIPKGYVIHHIDGNSKNNDPSNLRLMKHGEHVALHHQLRREGNDPVDASDPDVIEDRAKHKKYYQSNLVKSRESRKRYKQEHSKKNAERNKRYRDSHREQRAEYNRKYDEEHREERAEYHRQRYQAKKDQIAEQHRVYRETHRAERSEYNKRYKQEHAELVRAKGRLYMAIKRGSDPAIIAKHQAEVDRLTVQQSK